MKPSPSFYWHWVCPLCILCIACLLVGCKPVLPIPVTKTPTPTAIITATAQPEENPPTPISPVDDDLALADVMSVQVSGTDESYQFAVEISSPDSGCDQYADWWEVLSEDGELIYRRILAHSHRDEQPFVRSGGPILITSATDVIVRAHMHPDGYGGKVMIGSVDEGFQITDIPPSFAETVETQEPLPSGCAF